MEQRDYIIIGLTLIAIIQHYKMWKLDKELYYTRVGFSAILQWLDKIHKIKPPQPEHDKDFAKILMEVKDDELTKNHLF